MPVTVAANCCVPPGFNVADIGATVTETGLEEPPQSISGRVVMAKRAVAIDGENRMTHPNLHLAD